MYHTVWKKILDRGQRRAGPRPGGFGNQFPPSPDEGRERRDGGGVGLSSHLRRALRRGRGGAWRQVEVRGRGRGLGPAPLSTSPPLSETASTLSPDVSILINYSHAYWMVF